MNRTTLVLQDIDIGLLAPVSLNIATGDCVTLHGPSGSGKTRLLRAIADLDIHTGSASINGEPRDSMDGPRWRKRVGYLPTESHWWSEHVGNHAPSWDKDVLQALGFEEDVLHWQTHRLSSGERQRLGLARLLAHAPEALLLDEPTANLDADNADRVEKVLANLGSGQRPPILWVSHDARQRARVSTRQLMIRDREVVEVTA